MHTLQREKLVFARAREIRIRQRMGRQIDSASRVHYRQLYPDPLSRRYLILIQSRLFSLTRFFRRDIRLSAWSKFAKYLSRWFTTMSIFRRHNEHKTRPCSLVLMRRLVPACLRLSATSSSVALHPSSTVHAPFLFVLLCLHQRRHAEVLYFPVGRPERIEAQAEPETGKAHNTPPLFLRYVRGHKVTEHVLSVISIPSFVSLSALHPGRHSITRLSIQIELSDKFPSRLLQPWIYTALLSNTVDLTENI